MDRDRIERRDFPVGRRGYDPAAVDEHLRRVADEFEAELAAPRRSVADSTSEQVRLILEAAERGASELRARAGEEASEHVARVEAAAGGMLSRLDALESELNRLLGTLRESGERLAEGLAELQATAAAGLAAADATPEPPPPAAAAPPAAGPPAPAAAAPPPAPDAAAEPPSPDPAAGPGSPPADASPNGDAVANGFPPPEDTRLDPGPTAGPDEGGARLIALNMALGGSSREDTARYLAEHFTLDDPGALLEDVFARAGR